LQNQDLNELLGTEISLRVPKGYPALAINSLRFKDLIQNAGLARTNEKNLEEKYTGILEPARLDELKSGLKRFILDAVVKDKPTILELTQDRDKFLHRFYSYVMTRIE